MIKPYFRLGRFVIRGIFDGTNFGYMASYRWYFLYLGKVVFEWMPIIERK